MITFCTFSFASVCSVGEEYARCEVEIIPVDESMQDDTFKKESVMVEIPLKEIPYVVREGEILVVAHDGENIIEVCGKDDRERDRRTARFKALVGE